MSINKSELIELLQNSINNKIIQFENSISDLKQSAENEGKSSAGDKYETAREMISQEINKVENQIKIFKNYLKSINKINLELINKLVSFGAIVETDKEIFFISVPYGKLIYKEHEVICISPEAPLSLLMQNSKNASFEFNKIKRKINSIY